MDKGANAEPVKGTLADILVVDDNPVNVRLLANILVNLGYKVRKATNGEMALDAIDAITPDLILLDINMPGMDGYQVCQTLKSSPKNSDIPVIFISALDEMADKLKGFEVGGIDYISKPFQLLEVQTRVKTHIALRHLQKQQQSNIESLAPKGNAKQNEDRAKPVPLLPGFEWAMRRAAPLQGSFDFYDCYGVGENCFNLVLGEVPDPQGSLCLENAPTLSLKAPYEVMPITPLFWGQLRCGDRKFVYANTGNHLAFIRRANGTIESLRGEARSTDSHPFPQRDWGTVHFEPQDSLVVMSCDPLSYQSPQSVSLEHVQCVLESATSAEDLLQQVLRVSQIELMLGKPLTSFVLRCI